MISLDDYVDVETHWTALYVSNNGVIFLTVLELGMFLKKLTKLLEIKTKKTNILRIQANNLIMCGYFCIGNTNYIY